MNMSLNKMSLSLINPQSFGFINQYVDMPTPPTVPRQPKASPLGHINMNVMYHVQDTIDRIQYYTLYEKWKIVDQVHKKYDVIQELTQFFTT